MKRVPIPRLALLFGILCMSSTALAHKIYSQKTFLPVRSPGVNLALESTTWHHTIYAKNQDHAASNVQLTGFYQRSCNSVDLGKHFGIGNGSNSFLVGPKPVGAAATTSEVFGDYIIHDQAVAAAAAGAAPASTLAGRVTFNPKHESAGVRLNFMQNIADHRNAMYLKVSLPVVYVRTDMGMTITDNTPVTLHQDGNDTNPAIVATYTLADYFKGGVNVLAAQDDQDLQSPLTHAKIDGPRSSTGFSDLDVQLGYRCYEGEKGFFFVNVATVLPTSNKPKGQYLFEPVRGNGAHIGMGVGADGGFQFWSAHDSSAQLRASVNYRFITEGTEHRTLALRTGNFTDLGATRLGHYALLGKSDQRTQPLIPAANVLTQGVTVKPGNCLDAVLDLAVTNGNFTMDLGYNMFWKDRERIWMKDNAWNDSAYAIPITEYVTTGQFERVQWTNLRTITSNDIDVQAAASSEAMTNKFFAGLGYSGELANKYPCFAGLGGAYEFARGNNALETWSIWAKTGLTF